MKTIDKIMFEEYGAGLGIYDPTSIIWASDKAADLIGVEAAKAELKAVNRQREKLGLPVAVHAFGHRLF